VTLRCPGTDRVTASFYNRLQSESRAGRKDLWQPFAVSNDDRWVQASSGSFLQTHHRAGACLSSPRQLVQHRCGVQGVPDGEAPRSDLTIFSVRLTHSGCGPQSDMHAWADTVHGNMTTDIWRSSKTAAQSFHVLFTDYYPGPFRVFFAVSSLGPVDSSIIYLLT
jgi:hypothetical protein